jgi:hypothetical protein
LETFAAEVFSPLAEQLRKRQKEGLLEVLHDVLVRPG